MIVIFLYTYIVRSRRNRVSNYFASFHIFASYHRHIIIVTHIIPWYITIFPRKIELKCPYLTLDTFHLRIELRSWDTDLKFRISTRFE